MDNEQKFPELNNPDVQKKLSKIKEELKKRYEGVQKAESPIWKCASTILAAKELGCIKPGDDLSKNTIGIKKGPKELMKKIDHLYREIWGNTSTGNERIQQTRKAIQAFDAAGLLIKYHVPERGATMQAKAESSVVPEREVLETTYNDEYCNLLKSNKNLILTGAPGTGKTYLAKEIAKAIISGDGRQNENEQIGFVQFHPSYDYTDFVEGLRAEEVNGQVTFKLRNGIFKNFCKAALENPTSSYVFVIDEINRGEISKIFGELFFSIDPGYRGKRGKVKTQYTNIQSDETETIFDKEEGQGWFYVPENVYIIGTMNDIDRSVESFDFAMRRRFVWREITAEESAQNMGEKIPAEAKKRMASLNQAILNTPGLGASYQLGGAYFLPKDGESEIDYQRWWELRFKPLLKEYLRGMPSSDEKIEELKGIYTSSREDSDAENN